MALARQWVNYWFEMVREAGVEPTTFGFGDRRSIQLSYSRVTVPPYQLVGPGSIVICGFDNRAQVVTAFPNAGFIQSRPATSYALLRERGVPLSCP
jgi:hypothetical protein